MSDEELATITFRLPAALREKIETQAASEERSVSGFVRYHLGALVGVTDDDTKTSEGAQ